MTTPACNWTINLKPSRQLAQLLVVGHLVAAVSLLLVDIGWLWRLAGWSFVVLHGVYVWWDIRWLRRLTQLKYSDGQYQAFGSDGPCDEGQGAGYFVTPWLVILKVSVSGKARLLPLFRDSCNPDDLRRLRVFLRVSNSSN